MREIRLDDEEQQLVGYFRLLTAGQRALVMHVMSEMTGQEAQDLPPNVVPLHSRRPVNH